MDKEQLLEWQRKLDPSNFNQKRGAHYHTAPSVIFPGSDDYPKRAPKNSVTILFYIDAANWLSTEDKLEVKKPLFVEKPPKTKSAKHGPIMILTDKEALGAVVTTDNYYWSAWTLSQHEVWKARFSKTKANAKGQQKILVVATFIDEEAN